MNQYESIPEELKLLPQWVCHTNKVPNPATGKAAKAGQPDVGKVVDAVKAVGNYEGSALNSITTVLSALTLIR